MLHHQNARKVHRPRWINLHKDILELFVEAQQYLVEKAHSRHGQIRAHSALMVRPGFNTKERVQYPSVEVMRIRHRKEWKPKREEPMLPCSVCSVYLHTPAQRQAHIISHHGKDAWSKAKDQDLIEKSGFSNAIVYKPG